MKSDGSSKNSESKAFEHVIRYEDGIKSDFVLASCSVPVNYDYTKLNVENRVLVREGLDEEAVSVGNSQHTGSGSTSIRYFWDGGLLANTPLRQTILAHRDYWLRVRKLEYGIPRLRYGIINLHPAKQDYLPTDYDGVIDRKNDIIFHDRTLFDESIAILLSDFAALVDSLTKLAEEKGVDREALQKILDEETRVIYLGTGERIRYNDLLKGRVDVDFVVRLERKNDSHTISNKIFDFSENTIRQLIQDGYNESKEQMKGIIARLRREFSGR